MNFDSFYTELISDQRWVELLRHYKDETIRKAAEKVWAQLIADKMEDVRPMPENRKHVYNICIKGGSGDKPLPKPFAVIQAEKKEAERVQEIATYTKEHADKCAKEALEIIANSKTLNYFPRPSKKEVAEEGGWRPKEAAPYPVTTAEEAYIRDRHLAWIDDSFEPKTGMKLPGALDEETFNAIYDSEKLNGQGK